jgi:DNA-binding NtrC family response regulator
MSVNVPKQLNFSQEPRILIIDEDDFDGSVLEDCIREYTAKCSILKVEDGRKAVQAHLSFKPHLSLIEVRGIRVCGIDTLKHIQARSPSPVGRLVMFTESTDPAQAADAILNGADRFIEKPSSLEAYQEVAAQFLQMARDELFAQLTLASERASLQNAIDSCELANENEVVAASERPLTAG